MKLHPVFKPVRKFDRVRSVNLYREAVVVYFERDRDGLRNSYVKVAHPSVVPQLSVVWREGVDRILLKPGVLLTALATGKRVYLEPWPSNNSDNLRNAGLNQETLAVNVQGLGYFNLNNVTDMTSSDFELFGAKVLGRWARHAQQDQKWADVEKDGRYYYGGDPVLGYYPPEPKADAGQTSADEEAAHAR